MTSFVSPCVSPCQTELEFVSFYLKRIRQRENCIFLADFLCLDTRPRNIVYFSPEKFPRIQFYAQVTGIAPKRENSWESGTGGQWIKWQEPRWQVTGVNHTLQILKVWHSIKYLRKNKKKTCEPYNVNEYYLCIVTNKQ